jgi:hypothetical protein
MKNVKDTEYTIAQPEQLHQSNHPKDFIIEATQSKKL